MGFYINPPGGDKETWLNANGTQVSADVAKSHPAGRNEQFVVCLVDNGWMDAAGIAFEDHERDVFAQPDGRQKKWFLVKREALVPYCKVLA